MGLVNFDTTVQKNVNLNKAVDLNVDKLVFSNANVQGRLATSEASADSTGGGDGGPGEITTRDFLIDDFDEFQRVEIIDDLPPNPNTGEAPGSGPFSQRDATSTAETDAENFPFTDTDIAAVEGGQPLRTTVVENINIGDGSASAGTGNVTIDAGGTEPGNSLISFSADENTLSNDSVSYSADVDGDDAFGELVDDAFSVIVDCPPEFFDVANTQNRLVLEGADFGGLEVDGTLRVEAAVTDSDGATATIAAYSTPDFAAGQNIILPLGLFTGSVSLAESGEEILPGFFSVGQDTANINFEQIVNIEFRVLGDPAEFADSPFPDLAPGENPTPDAFDVSFDNLRIETICERPGEGGNLAETDTFAQVDDFGAFSFSESLAASSAEADVLIA